MLIKQHRRYIGCHGIDIKKKNRFILSQRIMTKKF